MTDVLRRLASEKHVLCSVYIFVNKSVDIVYYTRRLVLRTVQLHTTGDIRILWGRRILGPTELLQ